MLDQQPITEATPSEITGPESVTPAPIETVYDLYEQTAPVRSEDLAAMADRARNTAFNHTQSPELEPVLLPANKITAYIANVARPGALNRFN